MSSSKGIPLEEDVYTEALSHVIERDFFPDLKVLKAEASFLDALDSHDLLQIQMAQERLQNIDRPISPPTLVSSLNEDEQVLVNTDLSINQFQSKYTSEDNASFHHILDENNKKLRSKLAWMFSDEKKYQHAITDGSEKKRPAQVLTWEHKGRNALMFTPSGATYPASSTISNSTSDTNVVPISTPSSSSTSSSSTSEKYVQYHATRFHSATPLTELLEGQTLPISLPPSTSSSSSASHSLIAMTPVPAIDEGPPAMTWGSIEATPIQVQNTPLRYHVPATPKRETLLHSLTNSSSAVPSHHPKRRKLVQQGDPMLRASYSRDPRSNLQKTPSEWSVRSQRSTMTSFSFTPMKKP